MRMPFDEQMGISLVEKMKKKYLPAEKVQEELKKKLAAQKAAEEKIIGKSIYEAAKADVKSKARPIGIMLAIGAGAILLF